ncbi:MAG: ABC transporter ATP-binding protein [Lentimicrobiaceae bacterium]
MLEIRNLYKKFNRFAMEDVNLSVLPSDYHILLGESGSGKSVLLELIAGITPVDSGTITLFGKDITYISTGKRRTGLIFQSPAIFPHLTVAQNIAFPLFRLNAAAKYERVKQLADAMGIVHLLNQKSTILSGGELQRVALARILASEPLILLLDEPLSAIDTSMKADLRGLLRSLNKRGLPVLHVTHDFEEAVALGNKIAIIDKGHIVQSGTTQEVIDNPKTTFSASFTGERNFFKGIIRDNLMVIPDKLNRKITIKLGESFQSDEASVLIRSKHITIALQEPELSNLNNFKGVISAINPKKDGYQICIDTGLNLYAYITDESFDKMHLSEGTIVWASFKASAVEVIL